MSRSCLQLCSVELRSRCVHLRSRIGFCKRRSICAFTGERHVCACYGPHGRRPRAKRQAQGGLAQEDLLSTPSSRLRRRATCAGAGGSADMAAEEECNGALRDLLCQAVDPTACTRAQDDPGALCAYAAHLWFRRASQRGNSESSNLPCLKIRGRARRLRRSRAPTPKRAGPLR